MDAFLLVLGLVYIVGFCLALWFGAQRLVRRWRRLWAASRRRSVRLEAFGTAVALAIWYLGSRVVP